jgi:dipeptidyl aminopeptidase/acylaminoacyl peptidase
MRAAAVQVLMVLAVVLLAAAATPAFAQPAMPPGQQAAGVPASRPIRETDLFSFTWIADPQVSPDGSRVAFTRVVVDEKRTGYETSIWSVETSGSAEAVRLTNGVRDSQPRWSPDGRRLAFVRGGERGEDGKPRPAQIAVLPLSGGEAWTLTELPRGASSPAWSPDGKRLAFLSSTTPEDLKRAAAPKRGEAAGTAESADTARESDVHLVTRAVYRSNDQGFLDPSRRQHVWVIDVPDVRGGPTNRGS